MTEHYVQPPKTGTARRLLRSWLRRDDGVSAVEFALFAPILFFGLVATVDVGLALYERMTIDHVLRAGAQSAMADPGRARVRNVLASTASKSFVVSDQCGDADEGALDLCVDRYFACPEDPDSAVASSTFCAGSQAPNIYYRLTGTTSYDGLFLPIGIGRFTLGPVALGSMAQVQVR